MKWSFVLISLCSVAIGSMFMLPLVRPLLIANNSATKVDVTSYEEQELNASSNSLSEEVASTMLQVAIEKFLDSNVVITVSGRGSFKNIKADFVGVYTQTAIKYDITTRHGTIHVVESAKKIYASVDEKSWYIISPEMQKQFGVSSSQLLPTRQALLSVDMHTVKGLVPGKDYSLLGTIACDKSECYVFSVTGVNNPFIIAIEKETNRVTNVQFVRESESVQKFTTQYDGLIQIPNAKALAGVQALIVGGQIMNILRE